MLKPDRIKTNVRPEVIQRLGNNTYYYNYDIKDSVVDKEDQTTGDTIQETEWSFIQVHLHGTPDYKQCVRAIIRSYVDQDEEFDLINSANSIRMGLSTDVNDDYSQYLRLVANIKENVKKDFK